MHIERARVMNYKCIDDSGWVDFEEDLTRFVGANEAGKTSFLEALSNYDKQRPVDPDNVSRYCPQTRDGYNVPVSVVELQANPISAKIDPKRTNRMFDSLNERRFIVRFCSGDIGVRKEFNPVRLSEGYDESYKNVDTDFIEEISSYPHLEYMIGKTDLNLIDKYNKSESYREFIEDVRPALDRGTILNNNSSIPSSGKTGMLDQIICAEILREVSIHPDNVRYSCSILDLEAESVPEINICEEIREIPTSWSHSTSADVNSPYSVLFDKTEHHKEIPVTTTERRRAENDLTGLINDNWSNKPLEIRITEIGDKMSLEISSKYNKQVVTMPDERSEGFRWFLSFCLEVLFSDTEEDILLLDDPGSGLHPEANKKVRDALENFAEDTQTAYSTHSPYMLDTSDLDSIRLVQRENSETTKIVDDLSQVETDSPDALAPVRARLGAKHADSLFASDYNIIVEGFTDRKYLEAFSEFLGDGEPVLPDQLSITDASGGGNIETLAKMVIAEGYDYAILLDDDRGGQSSRENLLDAGIPEENIVMVSDAHDDDESSNDTIEDLLDDDVAIEALAQMHDSFDEDDLRGEIDGREHFPKRVISRLRELEGTEELDDPPTEMDRLAKGGMAEYVTRKVETGQWEEPELGGETVERFDTLLEDVLAVLESDEE